MGAASGNKILVTGASGMLGKALTKRLAAGSGVIGLSKSGREGSLRCDLSDPAQVARFFAENNPHAVIHTAAYSDVDGCERDPKLAHESNALAVKYLAEACSSKNIPLVHVSTDYVFDGQKKMPYVENDATCPVNIYGMTKLEGEYYALRCAAPSAVVRTSWLFGAGNPQNFVNAIIERLRSGSPVSVLDDQEDSPTYVEDLSEAIEKIVLRLLSGKSGKNEENIFHVCNAGSATRYAMTLKIREFLGLKNVRVEKTDRSQIKNRLAIRPAYCVMSTERYQKTFHTKLRSWEEALREYVNDRSGHVKSV
jgi:dTDP-4-dehydrorhamnose reductase